jgi:ferrochelatase
VSDVLRTWRWVPELRFINHYHDHRAYIDALGQRIEEYWQANGRSAFLLFSFHGVPQRYFLSGDPYHCHCHKTARLLAERLDLREDEWQLSFQSRFGREEWLKPYTDEALKALPVKGIKRVDVVCPGFAADCLETLEEIGQENRQYFLAAGGEHYRYIPALNESPVHIQALADLCLEHLAGWPEAADGWDEAQTIEASERSRRLAQAMGAPQ